MGLKYLGGQNWSEITREERFFCCELYREVMSREDGLSIFLDYVNEKLNSDFKIKDVNAEEWELGYEVAFCRDYYYNHDKKGSTSDHRKYDLCLFSDSVTIIIEAKAFGGFESKQVDYLFDVDVSDITNITNNRVLVLGLISSKYRERGKFSNKVTDRFTDGDFLLWSDLSRKFCGNKILQRADDVYGQKGN